MPGAHGGASSSPLAASVYTGRYTSNGAPDRRTKEWKAYVAVYPDSAMWRFEEMPAAPQTVSGSFAEMSRQERNAAFATHPSQIKDSKTFAEMKPRERNAAFAKHSSQIKKTPPVNGSTEPVLQTRAELALDFCWIASLRNALAQTMSDTPPPSPAPYGLDPFGHPHPAPYLAEGVPTDAELGEEFCAIRDAPLPDPEGYPMERTRRGAVASITFNDPRRCPRELVGSIAFDSTGIPRWPGMRKASPSPPPQRRLRSRWELVDGMWKGK
jgi:hypothetical protein